jgi:hypothetical protein
MRSSLRVAAACTALLATLVLVPAAGAAVKASAALQRAGDAFRLEVKVTSSKPFTAATRPRSAKVGTLSLKRVSSARKVVIFRSGTVTAADAAKLANSRAAIRVKSRRGVKTLRANVAPAPPAQTTPTAPTAPTAPTPPTTPTTPAAPAVTRDDAAGRAALSGDLLLEWSSYGSRTAEYRRIWLLTDGSFRLNQVDWNDVSGEICTKATTGTWTFKEGYTSPERGGLVLVKIGITTPSASGDEVLTFAAADRNAVYIGGTNPVRYERNPQIMQNC